jgi:RimJ/RimL family protein N-acetyltransferase
MNIKEDLIYRQVVTLKDGARVLLRPLVPEDQQALLNLFLPTTPEERRYMRHDVSDPDVVKQWTSNINYEEIFPVVAVVGDRIVGNATLHFGIGPAHHRAEIRIFLAKDFRRRGLGTRLTKALIDIAKRRSLYMLETQIVSDQVDDIKAMQKIGFESACIFEDYYRLPDGDLRDIVHLIYHLRGPESEF